MSDRRKFRPAWWALFLTMLLCAAFIRLGFWQLDRAAAKKAMLGAHAAALQATPQTLHPQAAESTYRRRVRVRGQYDPARGLLLDGQVSRGQPGFHVWTPLRLENSAAVIIVDRGWIPPGPARDRPIDVLTPPGTQEFTGLWQPLPRPGLRLAANECDRSSWPRVVQYPDIGELRCLLGPEIADGVLWLDAGEPDGFRREWMQGGIPPERHYGYALQWFALAAAVLVIFLVLSFRRVENP